jgi:hypothetical protein
VKRKPKAVFAVVGAAMLSVSLAGCFGDASPPPAQQQNQSLTQQIEQAATNNYTNYPLAQMKQGGWTEEHLVGEHLLRENDRNATRWITWLTMNGQVIASWPIKGMVFDPNSSLTETTDLACQGGSNAYGCGTVTSPGDNGTYGPEAGAAAFFTTSNVEVQLPASALWVESDAPLNVTTQPLITYNINSTPSVNHGGLTQIGGGH